MIIIFLYIVELFVIKIVKNVIQNYIGIFLENDFWPPPPLLSILYMDLIC